MKIIFIFFWCCAPNQPTTPRERVYNLFFFLSLECWNSNKGYIRMIFGGGNNIMNGMNIWSDNDEQEKNYIRKIKRKKKKKIVCL